MSVLRSIHLKVLICPLAGAFYAMFVIVRYSPTKCQMNRQGDMEGQFIPSN